MTNQEGYPTAGDIADQLFGGDGLDEMVAEGWVLAVGGDHMGALAAAPQLCRNMAEQVLSGLCAAEAGTADAADPVTPTPTEEEI